MNLSKTASAIGLFAYHQNHPGASLYARFYSLVREQIARLGVEPTYFGVSGEDYPTKYVKFGGQSHKKVVDCNFENINGLSIAVNLLGSKAPAYDSFFEGDISFTATSGFPQSMGGVVESWFVCNESFLPFGGGQFGRILRELIELHPWDFGMGFFDTTERRPVFHIGCLGHEKETPEEKEAKQVWYSTPPEVRVAKLRSIYPYNIINEQQLAQEVDPGVSLREFIESRSIGTLEHLPDGRLWLWKVPDPSQRRALRHQLYWKVSDWRQLSRGEIDWNQRGIVIDAATLIP